MAFVRISGPGGPHSYESDIYVYEHIDGGFACCGCRLNEGQEVKFAELRDMDGHLTDHQRNGDAVPVWMWYQVDLGPDTRVWVDTTVEELASAARTQGGKVLSWDADVPEDVRGNMDEIVRLLEQRQADLTAIDSVIEEMDVTSERSLPKGFAEWWREHRPET